MADRPGFMIYFDFAPALSRLTDEEAGKLFKVTMSYAKSGECCDLPGLCGFAFEVIRPRIDKDREVYEEKCRKNGYTAYVRESKRKGESYASYDEWLAITSDVHDRDQSLPDVHDRDQLNSTTTQLNNNSTTTENIEESSAPVHNPVVAAVVSDYLDRINPVASPNSLQELSAYAEELGEAVCKRAFDVALDNKKTTWSYIRAILRDKQASGVRCLADWDALERKRSGSKNSPQTGFYDYSNKEGSL